MWLYRGIEEIRQTRPIIFLRKLNYQFSKAWLIAGFIAEDLQGVEHPQYMFIYFLRVLISLTFAVSPSNPARAYVYVTKTLGTNYAGKLKAYYLVWLLNTHAQLNRVVSDYRLVFTTQSQSYFSAGTGYHYQHTKVCSIQDVVMWLRGGLVDTGH